MNQQKIYQVVVRGNFWGGRYYEVGLDSIFVLAKNEDDAETIAKDNIGEVEKHFRNKRYSGHKLAISKSDKYSMKTKDICKVKETKNKSYNKTLTSSGKFEQVSI